MHLYEIYQTQLHIKQQEALQWERLKQLADSCIRGAFFAPLDEPSLQHLKRLEACPLVGPYPFTVTNKVTLEVAIEDFLTKDLSGLDLHLTGNSLAREFSTLFWTLASTVAKQNPLLCVLAFNLPLDLVNLLKLNEFNPLLIAHLVNAIPHHFALAGSCPENHDTEQDPCLHQFRQYLQALDEGKIRQKTVAKNAYVRSLLKRPLNPISNVALTMPSSYPRDSLWLQCWLARNKVQRPSLARFLQFLEPEISFKTCWRCARNATNDARHNTSHLTFPQGFLGKRFEEYFNLYMHRAFSLRLDRVQFVEVFTYATLLTAVAADIKLTSLDDCGKLVSVTEKRFKDIWPIWFSTEAIL